MQANDAAAAKMSVSYWPRIQADIDADRLSTLGIVTVQSLWIGDVGLNHQVLAYGYQQLGRAVTLYVYDPNRGADDTITIRFDEAAPDSPIQSNILVKPKVRAFFPVQYGHVEPPDIEDADLVGSFAPTRLSAGQNFYYTVHAKNTGSTTWNRTDFLLGSQLPQDNTELGTARIPIVYDVPPRQSIPVIATLTPPDVVGPRNMAWQMVHEGVRWFGERVVNQIIVAEDAQCTAIREQIRTLLKHIDALRDNIGSLDPRRDQDFIKEIRKDIAQCQRDISTLRSSAATLGCASVG